MVDAGLMVSEVDMGLIASGIDVGLIVSGREWLHEQFENLTDTLVEIPPADYAEEVRYLPASVTPMPGYYSYDVAPYLREIINCFSPHSPVREFALMKGLQICATVGILENAVLFCIGHMSNVPVALVTADADMAKMRMDLYITPMINQSGLDDKIQSLDAKNTRKTGKTDKKIEWEGGGFLVPIGAQNPNKARSLSFQIMLCDEIDGWPISTEKSGDVCDRMKGRTAAYEATRKIAWISTPLITQTSNILKKYNAGDKRKFNIPCKHCGEYQHLEFNKVNNDGAIYGLCFSLDDESALIESSVLYYCKFCQGVMINEDKTKFLPAGKWVPTCKPSAPDVRSYHISALYSPVGMQSWTAQVRRWLECWDVVNGRAKDTEKLQVFYNEILGAPYTVGGQKLKIEAVHAHRRPNYFAGQIRNSLVEQETGGKIQFLTCAIDVHLRHLDLQIIGWAPRKIPYSIEWIKIEGAAEECENLDSPQWKKIREIIEEKTYTSDDGRKYNIQVTFLDSQYATDLVHNFCGDYTAGVFPIRGTELPVKGKTFKEFSEFTSKLGTVGYNITTTIYKDRLAASLRREWDGLTLQPDGYPNFPADYPDTFFKELTIERKVEVKDAKSGKVLGFEWKGRGAHAWDTLVYNAAACDVLALNTCEINLKLEEIDYPQFWALCERDGLFWEKA